MLRHGDAIDDDTRVVAFDASYIGTGQVGANVRYELTYDGAAGPATIVAKFSSRDAQSAATGVATLTYETEVAFDNELASTVDISRPHCYFAELEHGTANVVLVMEDLAPGEQGDQIAGCDVDSCDDRHRRGGEAARTTVGRSDARGPRLARPQQPVERHGHDAARRLGLVRRPLPVDAAPGHARGRSDARRRCSRG